MKRRFTLIILLFVILVPFSVYAQSGTFQSDIQKIQGVVSVEKITPNTFFDEAYEIMIEQYLDHNNKSAGTFEQRVILSIYNKFSPVVFVTEGYRADYAAKSSYINELSRIVEANQLVLEHRYFGESKPTDNTSWQYLTIDQAVNDLHRVYKMFDKFFVNNNKWIATGISKGGQNTIAYKAYYPSDMDGWIAYVGPVNFSVEDKRMQKHIGKVGSPTCRQKIEDFQSNVLKNRNEIQVLFDSLITAEGYTFNISSNEVLDYCVLEYSFAFWQWGHSCSSIPDNDATYRQLFTHLVDVSSPDYFAVGEIEKIKPFFIQALKDFGYYSYNTRPLKKLLTIKNAKNYVSTVFVPDAPKFKYSKKTSKFIQKAIQSDGENLILIYGEYDPWTAAGIFPKSGSKANAFIMPQGSHKTRIDSMPYDLQGEVYKILETFLGMN